MCKQIIVILEMATFTPVNQIRLTNVAIVRLKKGGKRFEVAAYPNKVLSWRNGLEKDLDEVLQTDSIFTNVSKGMTAKNADVEKCFGTSDIKQAVLTILEKGEIQVSERERQHMTEQIMRDIVNMVSEKCIHKETQRPITVGLVEKGLKDIHFTVNVNKAAKAQALDAIRKLSAVLPIERAQMRLAITCPLKYSKNVKKQAQKMVTKVEKEDVLDRLNLVVICEPGALRQIDEVLQKETRGEGTVEVVDYRVSTVEESGL
eukprot:GCRY01004020.1.p1 GENE.GCRY01004020.1~~GCRY01004020.1.p1  ORF type:complete len:272 (+),score=37.96 GCRY01004020.1:37-816(+)